MSAHTPGPWIANLNEGACYFQGVTRDGWTIEGPDMVPAYEYPMFNEADARLIAAAPELLEALKDLLRRIADDEEYGPDHAVTKARAAITKATGEHA